MSGNPFDDFAAEFRAAIPQTEKQQQSIIPEAAPSLASKPVVMNSVAPAQPPVSAIGGYSPYMMQPMGSAYPPAPMMGSVPTPPVQLPGMMGAYPSQVPMMAPSPNYSPWGVPPPMDANNAMGGSLVPSTIPSNPYASMLGPMGVNTQSPSPFTTNMGNNPMMGTMPPRPMPPTVAPPPPSMAPPPAPPAAPYVSLAPAPTATFDPMAPHDPWGPPPPTTSSAVVPTSTVVDDPFGVFSSLPSNPAPTVAPPQIPNSQITVGIDDDDDVPTSATSSAPTMTQNQILAAADDFWGDMGFGPPIPTTSVKSTYIGDAGSASYSSAGAQTASSNSARKVGELPPGGEWYDARIFTPTLGVMFFKPKELVDSLFLQTDPALVEALEDRPVVAFIVEGSSARSAGVELGHVLLKVNGIDVKNPKEASRLIKEGPRPLPLLFYVPDTTVVVSEGEHMVKYDTRDTGAPNSAKDWKPKYVVIGGIIAQPWMMNMYRSKSEYDIAVIETQARRPVSVKVKQFSLQGARIMNDWQGPQVVKYKNKLHPWKYIVVMPVARNPIKISSENLAQLKPVHEGIRRVLAAQQHNPSGGQSATASVRVDPYGRQYQEETPQQQQYSSNQQQFQYPLEQSNTNSTGVEQSNGISGGMSSGRRRQEY